MMIIGVDLGGTNIKAGLISDNKIIKKLEIKTEAKKGKKHSLDNLINVINELYSKEIEAIGIGSPAPLDNKKGILFGLKNLPGWNFNLKKTIEENQKLLEEKPHDPEIHLTLGRLYMSDKKYRKKALYHLKKTLEIAPKHKKRRIVELWIKQLEAK